MSAGNASEAATGASSQAPPSGAAATLQVPADPALRAAWALAVVQSLTLVPTLLTTSRGTVIRMVVFPIRDPWFPEWLQHPATYLLPPILMLVAALHLVLRPSVRSLRVWAGASLFAGVMLLLHQVSFGWAVAPLVFWSGLWAAWLATSGIARPQLATRRGPFLCLLLIGLIFAFPAIGKATPGFTSGEVFWALHWEPGLGLHGWLDGALGREAHRELVTVYGPIALAIEALLAFVWLLPARLGFPAVLVGVGGILFSATPMFYDAMGLLAGLAVSGWVLAESGAEPRA